MKTKLFFTLLFCLSIISCNKEKIVDNTVYVKTPSELIGSWTWNNTYGGYAFIKYDPISTGKSIKIELDSQNSYKYFSNDTLKYESTFRIAKQESIFRHADSVLAIIIDPNQEYYKNFTKSWNDLVFNCYLSFRSNDTLIFTDPAYDGLDHTYIKIK